MTFFCTNATRKKPPETHSELSGRCVGGASPLIFLRGVFRGWGLKKGKNESNRRRGGCELSRPQASPGGSGCASKVKAKGWGFKSDVRTPLSGAQKGKMPLRMN